MREPMSTSAVIGYIAIALRGLRDGRKQFALSVTERKRHDAEYQEVVSWLDKLIEKATKESR